MDDRTFDLGIPGLGPARLIGRGGFGEVYLARQESLDRDVAVKILPAEAVETGAWDLFERERRTMGAVSSRDGIVTVFDSGTTPDGRPYLMMEYLDGGSIGTLLRLSGPLPERRAVEIGITIAKAVQAVHRQGILHRDIKPDNILMSSSGEARLTDFGIAKMVSATASKTSNVAVTVAYAPPEVLNGDPATPASDIFEIGATVHAMLAGHSPFKRTESDSIAIIVQRALAADAPDLRELGVSEAVAAVVEKALAQDPAERHATADDLAEALKETIRREREPRGAVTFLFGELQDEESIRQAHGEAVSGAVKTLTDIVDVALDHHNGERLGFDGGLAAAFTDPVDAARAALEVRAAVADHDWRPLDTMALKLAIHAGTARIRHGEYSGPTLTRGAHLLDLAAGGQIILSAAAHELIADSLPELAPVADRGRHELESLGRPEHVYELAPPTGIGDGAVRTAGHRPPSLPTPLTSFIGRDRALTDVTAQLRDSRLVTITGPGGVGKTRVAIEVAALEAEAFPDGVYFVDFGSVIDEDLVAKTIATALDVGEQPSRDLVTGVTTALGEDAALVVFDNCEHVVEQVAGMAAALLDRCPNIRVLVTSREQLRIPGEATWNLASLDVPEDSTDPDSLLDVEAVELFVNRARLARHGFELTDANRADVTAIVTRLDGLPLAIELAASRVDAMSPANILERLATEPDRVLRGSPRLPDRHQTLDEAIQWSYDLLTADEQIVFDRLSVFAGPFTIEAAEAVAGFEPVHPDFVFDVVMHLVGKSMVSPATDDDPNRFHILSTLREYGARALERHDDAEALAERHARYFVQLVDQLAPDIGGPNPETARDRIACEYHDIRAVMAWCLDRGEHAWASRLVTGLTWFWYWRGYYGEANRWIHRLLDDMPAEDSPVRARLLYSAGLIDDVSGELHSSQLALSRGLEMSRRIDAQPLVARFLTGMGVIQRDHGVLREAATYLDEAVTTARRLDMPEAVALALRFRGDVAFMVGDIATAKRTLEEALRLFDDLGRREDRGWALISMARVHAGVGRMDDALDALEEAVALHTATAYRRGQGWARALIAHLHVRRGQTVQARQLLDQAIADLAAVGDLRGQAHAGLIAATLERADKRPDEARRRLDESEQVATSIGEQRVIGLIGLERAEIEEAAGNREAANQLAAIAIGHLAEVGDTFNLLEVAGVWGRTTSDTGGAWRVRGFTETVRSALSLPAERSRWPAGADDPAALAEGRGMDEFDVAALVSGAHAPGDG